MRLARSDMREGLAAERAYFSRQVVLVIGAAAQAQLPMCVASPCVCAGRCVLGEQDAVVVAACNGLYSNATETGNAGEVIDAIHRWSQSEAVAPVGRA